MSDPSEWGGRSLPLVVGGLVLSLMLVFFWLTGALFPADSNGLDMSPAQITGMALTYSVTPAFLLASLIYSHRRTRISIDQLVDLGRVDLVATNAQVRSVGGAGLGLTGNVAATLLGLFLGAAQVTWARVFDSLGDPGMSYVLSIAIGNIWTWLVVVHVVMRRVVASADLRRLGQSSTKIDLLRPDTLLPFGRVATLHLLMVAIAVSLSALQSLDAELRWVNYSAALAAGIPAGLVLVLLPMLGIRHSVRVAKRCTLEELDAAIEHADRELEPDALRYLSDLLHQRETIANARDWPLDTTAFSRIAIYFVIPPIAWVGGALVEILVAAAI